MHKLLPIFLWMLLVVQNNYGQSVLFNGSNNYVNLGNAQALHLKSFTLEAWVKPEGTGIKASSGRGGTMAVPIITKGRGEEDFPATVNLNYFLGIDADNKLAADFEEASGQNHPVSSKASIADSVWTHVAVTYDAGTAVWKLYINGKLDATKDLGSNVVPASVSIQPAAIGSSLNSKGVADGYFKGKIDEVRIWKTARSGDDIFKNYSSELTSGTGLVARYSLNEDMGTTTFNSIATSGDGLLINNPRWTNGYNNHAPYVPVKTSPTSASAANSETSIALCTTVNDKNNDRLRVRFYGRKKLTNKKFTIVLLPDTQYYTSEKMGGSNRIFKSQTEWVVKHKQEKNIVYVGQLGDCTEHADAREIEWKRADTALMSLESSNATGLSQGIPYGVCVGNHDQSHVLDPRGTTAFYNQYFGVKRFDGRSYYGGHNGANNDNHYELFTAGGIDFLVICFEFDPTNGFCAAGGVLDWGEKLIKSNSARKVIVLTHWALNEDATFSVQGKAIYDRYKVYPNLFLIAGGHVAEATGEARRTDSYNGHKVSTILQDYQFRTNGGNGLMRIYEFDPGANKLSVKTYSPYTGSYETDADSQFDLPVDLNSAPHPYTFIGESTNDKPGSDVCVKWSSLLQDQDYEWYARVFDGEKTTTSPVWSFSTQTTTDTHTKSQKEEPRIEIRLATDSLNRSFTIYPNPNTTSHVSLTLSRGVKGPVSIQVFDINGREQLKKELNATGNIITFDHHLSNGTYIVVVKTGSTKESRKLIVVN